MDNSKHNPGNANLPIGSLHDAKIGGLHDAKIGGLHDAKIGGLSGNANLPIGGVNDAKNAIQENGAPRWHSRGYLPAGGPGTIP